MRSAAIIATAFAASVAALTAARAETGTGATNSIQLEITTHLGGSQTFIEGDTLAFFISINRDAHLLVLYQDAAGQLLQIIPNEHMRDQRYTAGLFIRVPDITTQHHFKITAPFGNEKIFAFASASPLPIQQGNTMSNGLKLLGTDTQQIIDKIRRYSKTSGIASGEAVLEFTTEASSFR